jgi:hypothetical protein
LCHEHNLKKTKVTLIEYDDVKFDKVVDDLRYYGEGNSKNRTLKFNFEYCLDCNLRLLNGKPAITADILEDEFERLVSQAKKGSYKAAAHLTIQHSEFEVIQRLIKAALKFGKLKQTF